MTGFTTFCDYYFKACFEWHPTDAIFYADLMVRELHFPHAQACGDQKQFRAMLQ